MEKYASYVAKNIIQLRKSQVNAKWDKDLRNTAKKHAMEANLLVDKDVNFENEVEDLKVKDEENIVMSITDSFLHAVIIACNY